MMGVNSRHKANRDKEKIRVLRKRIELLYKETSAIGFDQPEIENWEGRAFLNPIKGLIFCALSMLNARFVGKEDWDDRKREILKITDLIAEESRHLRSVVELAAPGSDFFCLDRRIAKSGETCEGLGGSPCECGSFDVGGDDQVIDDMRAFIDDVFGVGGIVGDIKMSGCVDIAQELLGVVKKTGESVFNRRLVHRKSPRSSPLKRAEIFDQAVKVLLEHGLIERAPGATVGGHKAKEAYRITDAV